MTTRNPGPQASATIYSVAEAAGVSIATVSRVLQGTTAVSDRTRTKVLDAVDQLDYIPVAAARSLAVRHHEAIGLVLPELRGPYYSELLMGFEGAAAELGLGVVVALGETARTPGPESFARLSAGVDGLAVLGGAVPDGLLRRTARQKPVVVLASDDLAGVEGLHAENAGSAEQLAAHLLDEHGRRRLVFAGDPDRAPDVRARYLGFAAALAVRGLAVPEPLRSGMRESDGRQLADLVILGDLTADAVVCANDELAIAMIDRLERAGHRLPDDLAVVGWDDIMAARYVRPRLTTVAQPVRELGALAATRLHDRISGGAARADPTVLATTVVFRGSCGCPDS